MRRYPRPLIASAFVAFLVAYGWFDGAKATALFQTPARSAPPGAADRSGMTMALTGDSIITMKLSVHTDPQFVKMIDLIRGADVAFTNLEMLFHDYEP